MSNRTHIRIITVLLALVLGTAGVACAQDGTVQYGKANLQRDYCKNYKITIKADKQYDDTSLYLYSYSFGETSLIDSAFLKNGQAVFMGKASTKSNSDISGMIPKGFYMILSKRMLEYEIKSGISDAIELQDAIIFLLNQQTSINLSFGNNPPATFKVLNSSDENKVMYSLMISRIEQDVTNHNRIVDEVISTMPQSFLGKEFRLNRDVLDVVGSFLIQFPQVDSSEFHRILSSADFTDGRLCHSTSALFPFIERYLTSDNRESTSEIITEVDTILMRAARGGRYQCGIYAQWLYGIFDKTGDPYYEPVLLHIYDTYDRGWIPEDQERRIKRQMDRIRKLAPGAQIPELTAFDINGKQHSTNEIQTKYTILWFWDPDCDHCQAETPVLHDLYQKEADNLNFEVFAVEVNDDYDRWKAFSEKHGLSDWINLSTSMGETSVDYIEYFDIVTTPVILLIDNEKNHAIIARQVTLDEIMRLMK